MSAADIVDEAISERVVVFGSLPPGGRDLDLVVRAPERSSIESALERAGYSNRGVQWVRFHGDSADAVDLVPVESWRLPPDVAEDLFTEALAIEGFSHLARPAPHHVLLIMARRVVRSGGELDPKKRARVRAALDEDPDGWAHAQRAATGWSSYRAVVALERLYKTGVPTGKQARIAALTEIYGSKGKALKIASGGRARPVLVTFSGLDGSGKTSQAEAVKRSLEAIAGETVIVWTRLSYNPSLKALAKPIKTMLGARPRGPGGSDVAPSTDPGKELRKRSALVTQMWASAVATANAAAQRRVTGYHMKRGRNVVSDRYTLDSRVHLRYRYGERKRFRLQAWIISALSPKPTRAFFVDVPAQVAFERKAEQYDLEQLETQSRLYREELADDIMRLDGTRPREELAEEVSEEVWRALA
jgi:thymidylate kinase